MVSLFIKAIVYNTIPNQPIQPSLFRTTNSIKPLGIHLRLDRFLNGIVVLGLCAGFFARVAPACVVSPYLCLMSWGDGYESPCEENECFNKGGER